MQLKPLCHHGRGMNYSGGSNTERLRISDGRQRSNHGLDHSKTELSQPRPFSKYKKNYSFYIKRPSLDHSKTELSQVVLYEIFFRKRPRLAVVRFLNGKKFGFRMVWTVQKPNFETFGNRMDSEFKCSEFEPWLYTFSAILASNIQIRQRRVGNVAQACQHQNFLPQ